MAARPRRRLSQPVEFIDNMERLPGVLDESRSPGMHQP
jgi:hypothetical protein